MKKRFLQRFQCGEFLIVEVGESQCFFPKAIELCNNAILLRDAWVANVKGLRFGKIDRLMNGTTREAQKSSASLREN